MKLKSMVRTSLCKRHRNRGIRFKVIVFCITLMLTSLLKEQHKENNTLMGKQGFLESEWRQVVSNFIKNTPSISFSTKRIMKHFNSNENSSRNVSLLVHLNLTNAVISSETQLKSGQSRGSSLRFILRELLKSGLLHSKIPSKGVTFLVMLNDGHAPQVATFGSARHWNSWTMMIPVPLGNDRGLLEGWGTPLQDWDLYIEKTISKNQWRFSWNNKIPKAVFRGALGMQRYVLGSCNWQNKGNCKVAKHWRDVNRGVLYTRAQGMQSVFDVGFTAYRSKSFAPKSQLDGAPPLVPAMEVESYQKYKMVLNVGSNQDWAERLRSLLFMNSAIVLHEAETKEFFTPLLQPWVHYIPTDINFSNLVENVAWGTKNDADLKNIVTQANKFARTYLSEKAMLLYWAVLLEMYAKKQISIDKSYEN